MLANLNRRDAADELSKVPWKPVDGLKAAALLFILFYIIAQTTIIVTSLLDLPTDIVFPALAILTFFLVIFSTWLFTIHKYRVTLEQLGWRGLKPPGIWSYLSVLLITPVVYVFLLMLISIYAYLLDYLFQAKVPELPVIQLFGKSRGGFFLAFMVIVVLAPFTEELFFRGFLYTAFRKRFGVAAGALLSTVFFALFHFQLLLLVPMIIIGGALALLYEYRRSLIAPVLLHALNNLVGLLYLYLKS